MADIGEVGNGLRENHIRKGTEMEDCEFHGIETERWMDKLMKVWEMDC